MNIDNSVKWRGMVIGLVWICGCLGCGSMREVGRNVGVLRGSSDSSVVLRGSEKSSGSREMEWVRMSNDSLQEDYTLTVWPKGKFSYSPVEGFEGEALKVVIQGSRKMGKAVMNRQSLEESGTRVAEHKLEAKQHTEGYEKVVRVRKWLSWKMVLGICVLLLGLVFLCLRKT